MLLNEYIFNYQVVDLTKFYNFSIKIGSIRFHIYEELVNFIYVLSRNGFIVVAAYDNHL